VCFPNDSTNSHQAVAILKERGFDVRYQGRMVPGGEKEEQKKEATPPSIDDLLRRLRGRYKGAHSLVEDREREHRIEKDRALR
jgi:hypothetical protein